MQFLRVSDGKILNQKGKSIILKGINLGGWLMLEGYILGGVNFPEQEFKRRLKQSIGTNEVKKFLWRYRKNFINEQDIKRIKRLGFNCARLPINYRFLEEEGGLSFLDRVLAQFERASLYCILDLHAAYGSQNKDWHSDSFGKSLLWESQTCQDRFVKIWAKIAKRYKDEGCIAGFDILNEAVTSKTKTLRSLYKRAIEAIRKYDRNHIIILEGNNWASDLDCILPIRDRNVVLSPHFYRPISYVFNFTPHKKYPGRIEGELWNKAKISKLLAPYNKTKEKYRLPILVGEFGIASRCVVCNAELRWVEDILSVFKRFGFHWTYWTYKAVSNNIFPDGLYQLLENEPWVLREGVRRGWENFCQPKNDKRNKILRSLRTENFVLNKALYQTLKKFL